MSRLNKQLLFCPGPVNLSASIKNAIVNNEIGHREPEFSVVLESLGNNLLKLYQVKNFKEYHPVFITGSGTAANEAILSSIGHKYITIIANGEFGERLYEISKIHNPHTKILKFKWGEKIDPKTVEFYLQTNKVEAIAMVHHETSIGMLNPILEIGKLAKKHNKMFIVDTVSSAGAEMIDIKKCNISFCSSSASKAIGSLPGASYVIGKIEEFEKLKDIPPRTAYLNLWKFYYFSTHYKQTPNTPAVQTFIALDQALKDIVKESVEGRVQKIARRAQVIRKELEKMGLKFLLEKQEMSNVLTTVMTPDGISIDDLKKKLKERNIVVYDGKGDFKGKVFQIGNIGSLSREDIKYLLSSIKSVLDTINKPKITKRNYNLTQSTHKKHFV